MNNNSRKFFIISIQIQKHQGNQNGRSLERCETAQMLTITLQLWKVWTQESFQK